jgi:hypothetical protein
MTTLSIRGLGAQALAELKKRAALEDASVNALVLKLIDQGLGLQPAKPALRRHPDLDALAGSWGAPQAAEFEAATQAFRQVDPALWP